MSSKKSETLNNSVIGSTPPVIASFAAQSSESIAVPGLPRAFGPRNDENDNRLLRNGPISIALSGSKGRMGQCVQRSIAQNPQFVLSAELFNGQSPAEREQALENPIDVWIDFSTPEASLAYCKRCRTQSWKMVIGTTGFSDAQKAQIIDASKDIPIVLAPNTSVGHAILLKALALIAGASPDSDVGLIDIHHKYKKDAPSGTALMMAKVINEVSALRLSNNQILSLRLGDTIGEHEAIFALNNESLSIKHHVSDRSVFAQGALKAAAWVIHQGPGLYDMQSVLGL